MKSKILVSIFFVFFAHVALAEVIVSEARLKAPVPGQKVSAGYFVIKNAGAEPVSVKTVSSDSASRIEMHTHVMENGMMGMVKMDSVDLEPGESLSFTEGGHHLMVFDPDQRTMLSGEFDFIFDLSDGSQLEVFATVEKFVN